MFARTRASAGGCRGTSAETSLTTPKLGAARKKGSLAAPDRIVTLQHVGLTARKRDNSILFTADQPFGLA